MSQVDQLYPIIPCGGALTLHALTYGPPPHPYTYTCIEEYEDIPPVYIGAHVRMIPAMPLYRIVSNYATSMADLNEAVTTHDYIWNGSGDPAESDFEGVEARFDAFFTTISGFFGQGVRLMGYRWYELADDGSGASGPSFRFEERSQDLGSSSTMCAPQVACSVTQITPIRRRWGRFYLPFMTNNMISGGRIIPAWADTIADAAQDLEEPIGTTWQSCVYSTILPFALPIQAIRVDNVPDIIRSRRWRSATLRETRPVTVP